MIEALKKTVCAEAPITTILDRVNNRFKNEFMDFLNSVFSLFDADGDGVLAPTEFCAYQVRNWTCF